MRIVSRACAIVLVTLIVLPFSAPFSVGNESPSVRSATSHALPAARGPHRIKRVADTAVRGVAAVPQAARSVHAAGARLRSASNAPRVLPLRI
ncbi:MAG TPA: hypothetical protein VN628_12390 [Vicinamibacterales bacterium]|nr:hypothetical protein [Vicinamibacterales bacterium]